MQQIDGISAAYNTYQDKYGAIPGDDKDAKKNTGANVKNGDGNGSYSGTEGDKRVWEHLQAANLISGYTALKDGRFTNKYGLGSFFRTNYAKLSGAISCFAVPNDVAIEIDRKRDDGNGKTGSMRKHDGKKYPTKAGNSWICSAA
jgi:hypothetical protein